MTVTFSEGIADRTVCIARRSRKLLARTICSRAVIADPNMFTGVQHHIMADDPASRGASQNGSPVVCGLKGLEQLTGTNWRVASDYFGFQM
jgi:hypothetical protein